MFSSIEDLLAGCRDGGMDDQVCLYRVFGQTVACQRMLSVIYTFMEDILSHILPNIILFSSSIVTEPGSFLCSVMKPSPQLYNVDNYSEHCDRKQQKNA